MAATVATKPEELYLFHEGTLHHSYRLLGAHPAERGGSKGVVFGVWAPHACSVGVVGDFNGWNASNHGMERVSASGVWMLFVPDLGEGALYKYEIATEDGRRLIKADPYAFGAEVRPRTASVVTRLDGYRWEDAAWERDKRLIRPYDRPMLVYEVHPGTWRRKPDGSLYTYRELADRLVPYAAEMGFTHIEMMPVLEHPFDGSWGYQATGYFAATSRYGSPQDLMYFVDLCHRSGIGVIFDWVPAHFCKDEHGLRLFDGAPLYEYGDARKAERRGWGTLAFDYTRPEVRSFLISSAVYWLDVFHADGLRVDAVASMLHLNFERHDEPPLRNDRGGPENLEAVAFLKQLSEAVFRYYPNALMMAEDSTDWPLVTAPTYSGGLGFNFKWNMGWMNDVLRYMAMNGEQRKQSRNLLTFSLSYVLAENYILPLSHDEVVHLKKPLLGKMPGGPAQQFANLRLLYGYMMAHPGKKLLYMGGEIGELSEWNEKEPVAWELLADKPHRQLQHFVRDLNRLYAQEPAFWERDHEPGGFHWVDPAAPDDGILAFFRNGNEAEEALLFVFNFSEQAYAGYPLGLSDSCSFRPLLSSGYAEYGGTGRRKRASVKTKKKPWQDRPHCLEIDIAPLSFHIYKFETERSVTSPKRKKPKKEG